MKIGDLVTHWVSKRIGVVVNISYRHRSYKVQWFDEDKGLNCEMSRFYDESRLIAVKKCP